MKKTDKKTLEEIIRVDHAGERGAIKIYEGQLLALKTIKQDNDLKREISLSASMNYEKYIYENSMIGFAYYGLLSSQNTLSLGGNAFYKMNF